MTQSSMTAIIETRNATHPKWGTCEISLLRRADGSHVITIRRKPISATRDDTYTYPMTTEAEGRRLMAKLEGK